MQTEALGVNSFCLMLVGRASILPLLSCSLLLHRHCGFQSYVKPGQEESRFEGGFWVLSKRPGIRAGGFNQATPRLRFLGHLLQVSKCFGRVGGRVAVPAPSVWQVTQGKATGREDASTNTAQQDGRGGCFPPRVEEMEWARGGVPQGWANMSGCRAVLEVRGHQVLCFQNSLAPGLRDGTVTPFSQ